MGNFNPLESRVPVRGVSSTEWGGGSTVVMDEKRPCNDHRYVRAYSQVFPVHWGPQSWQERPVDWGW